MAIPLVEKCCCGCSVRTGSLVIGYLELLVNLGALAFFSSDLASDSPTIPTGRATCSLVGAVVGCVIAPLFLYGVHRYRAPFVFAGLVYFVLTFAVVCVEALVMGCQMLFLGTMAEGLSFIVTSGVMLGLDLYFTLVVYSFHKTMNKSEEYQQQEFGNAPKV